MRLRAPFQLKATAAVVALLMVLPGALLLLFPRGRAQGLERLLSQVSLLQSFPAAPRLPVPAIWQQRLGPALAVQAWSRQRLWWQFWAEHGDGGAYLAIPLVSLPQAALVHRPANSFQVDDLLVLAPDPLSLRLLQEELRLKQRQSRGLDQRCLHRLQQEQAVYWNRAGLGAMTGPVAPLLQHFQQGCLGLAIDGDQLALSGETTATPGYLAPPQRVVDQGMPAPLAPSQLLELRGPALDAVLSGLLARQLVRDPLAQRYGLGENQLALLRQTPFVLSLRSLPKGPFQAALTLRLAVGPQRRQWSQVLMGWRQPLVDQGLSDGAPALQSPAAARRAASFPTARWSRDDGQVVGGWRWQQQPGGEPQLLLYLGPEPKAAITNPLEAFPAATAPMQLRLRPRDLAALGLLPPDFPQLVRRSSQLALTASGQSRQPLSQLAGVLRWERSP